MNQRNIRFIREDYISYCGNSLIPIVCLINPFASSTGTGCKSIIAICSRWRSGLCKMGLGLRHLTNIAQQWQRYDLCWCR